eukprot:810295_1
MSFEASHSPIVTRSLSYHVSSSLPHEIFLDIDESYKFKVKIEADPANLKAANKGLGLQLLSSDHVAINSKSVKVLKKPYKLFEVEILDLGNPYEQSVPGQNLSVTPVRLEVEGNNFACSDRGKIKTSESLNVYTGCPPGRFVEFDVISSRNPLDDCSNPSNIPCFYYPDDFKPVLRIIDTLNGTTSRFRQHYKFSVVGSGRYADQITPFTPDEIENFNWGPSAIWAVLYNYDKSNIRPDLHGKVIYDGISVSWICSQGSPCSGVWPQYWFVRSPSIYLQLEVSTGGAVITRPSYCDYRATFLVELHGLTVDTWTALYMTLGTVWVLMMVTAFGFFRNKKQKK